MRILKFLFLLMFWPPVLATPLLGVWLASSWAAWANGPRWLILLAGALLFPILPVLWEMFASWRRAKRLARKRSGSGFIGRMNSRKSQERITSVFDRLLMRTLALNLVFLSVLLWGFPRQTLTAVGARGDWMLDEVQGVAANRARSVLRTLADRLQDYNADFNDNEFAEGADDHREPEPAEVQQVARKETKEATLHLVLPSTAQVQLKSHQFTGSNTLTLALEPTFVSIRLATGQRLKCAVDATAGTLELVGTKLGNEDCTELVAPDPEWKPSIHRITGRIRGSAELLLADPVLTPDDIERVQRNDPYLRIEIKGDEAKARWCEESRERRGYRFAVTVDGETRFVQIQREANCDGFIPIDTSTPFEEEHYSASGPDCAGGRVSWPQADAPDPRVLQVPSDVDSLGLLGDWIHTQGQTELERARLVHDWVAVHIHYDKESLEPGKRAPQDADTVFRRRTGVCAGYANLVRTLGKAAGLDVVYLTGNVRKGGKLAGSSHAWNAVKVDGSWLLMDATWDSGSETKENGLTDEYRSAYLFTPPEVFRADHLPENDAWQLAPPLSRGEFLRQPRLTVSAHVHGLSLVDPVTPQVESGPELAVQLSNPNHLHLMATLAGADCAVAGERITCPVPTGANELQIWGKPGTPYGSHPLMATITVQR